MSERRRPGRPSKYTPECTAKIVEGIRLGMTHDLAAQYGGIDERTFYSWQNRFPQFRHAIVEAEATGAAVNLARVQAAAQAGEWRASIWLLERRYPRQYGNPDELDRSHTRSPKLDVRILIVPSVDVDVVASNGHDALDEGTVIDLPLR